jgi:hypothetical protein
MKPTYTTKLWIRHSFTFMNYWLIFSKEIELPFVPFIGLQIWDGDISNPCCVQLKNDGHKNTTEIIWYQDHFEIYIECEFRSPMADFHIAGIIELFNVNGWTREDKENTENLIKTMAERYKMYNL